MGAPMVMELRSRPREFLGCFDDCLGDTRNRDHLLTYFDGQVGPLACKSVEPIALAANVPPRTFQEVLCTFKWDANQVRDAFQRRIAKERWRVERTFEDEKTELAMAHFEMK